MTWIAHQNQKQCNYVQKRSKNLLSEFHIWIGLEIYSLVYLALRKFFTRLKKLTRVLGYIVWVFWPIAVGSLGFFLSLHESNVSRNNNSSLSVLYIESEVRQLPLEKSWKNNCYTRNHYKSLLFLNLVEQIHVCPHIDKITFSGYLEEQFTFNFNITLKHTPSGYTFTQTLSNGQQSVSVQISTCNFGS